MKSLALSHGFVLIKNSLSSYLRLNFLGFCIDYFEFLMRQPRITAVSENKSIVSEVGIPRRRVIPSFASRHALPGCFSHHALEVIEKGGVIFITDLGRSLCRRASLAHQICRNVHFFDRNVMIYCHIHLL